MAEFFMPPFPVKDQLWKEFPRDLLEGLMLHCYQNGRFTYVDLRSLIESPPHIIKMRLEATEGADRARRHFANLDKLECLEVLETLVSRTKCFSNMYSKML